MSSPTVDQVNIADEVYSGYAALEKWRNEVNTKSYDSTLPCKDQVRAARVESVVWAAMEGVFDAINAAHTANDPVATLIMRRIRAEWDRKQRERDARAARV